MPPPISGSDVHVSEDIRRTMRSIAATHEATMRATCYDSQRPEYTAGYSDGFMDGLAAVAEALGIVFRPGVGNVAIGMRWEG